MNIQVERRRIYMRITFDSEDQKRQMIDSFCVDELFIDRDEACCQNCDDCWERHIEMEVEE